MIKQKVGHQDFRYADQAALFYRFGLAHTAINRSELISA